MYTLCPLNLEHCSSKVQMMEREILGDLIESKSCLNLDSLYLKSRYLIMFLNTCTCKVHVSILIALIERTIKFLYIYTANIFLYS